MARLTAAQRRQQEIETDRVQQTEAGNRYAVVHGINTTMRAYYPTLEAAEANRDRMLRAQEKSVPDDLHDRGGTLFHFWARIELDGALLPGTERSCVAGAEYPEHLRRGRR
jgi:hypothetical protein